MLTPLAMKHVQIQALTESLPRLSVALAEMDAFNPDPRPVHRDLPEDPGDQYRDLFLQATTRLDKIRQHVDLPPLMTIKNIQGIERDELEQADHRLGEIWEICSGYEEKLHCLAEEDRTIAQLEGALANFSTLNVDLAQLHRDERHFMSLHIGTVPRENVQQLREAAALANHLILSFLSTLDTHHVVVVGPRWVSGDEIQLVLNTAGFHSLVIPPEFRNRPEQMGQELQQRHHRLAEARRQTQAELSAWGRSLHQELTTLQTTLALAEPFAALDEAARNRGSLAVVQGWVPAREVERLSANLRQRLSGRCLIDVRDPLPEERPLVPVVIRHPRLITPFATLVQQFGIPRYGEVDPTWFFAITFVAMFGMMFGDVGHGLVLMAITGWQRKRLKQFLPLALLAGGISTLFGFLYGSLFCFEEVLPALWVAPLTQPIYMLKMALFWGIGFIFAVSLLSIRNRLVIGRWRAALFEHNGLIPLILYGAAALGLYGWQTQGQFGRVPVVVALTSLVSLMAYHWQHSTAPLGERALVTVIEALETILGYVSNTLSFLRVAAFSLNHVALGVAVFAIAKSMSSTGSVVTIILGNLFIIGLEAAIVTIQLLRLEYYEGFSRFFSGDGKLFRPLTLVQHIPASWRPRDAVARM
ncbi:MAG: V-type ATPase 116kDa subunit family protein [Pseudomonadota bacterium]